MKLYVIIPLFYFSSIVTFGQTVKFDSLTLQIEQQDLVTQSNRKVNSIQSSFHQKTDSLKEGYNKKFGKLDSVQSALRNKLDNLSSRQPASKDIFRGNKMDSLQSGIKSKIDSLISPDLQHKKITHALDSINNLRDSTLTSLNHKLQSLKDNSVEKLRALNLPPQLDNKVSQATANVEGFKIPASDLNISSLNLGDNDVLGKLDNFSIPSPAQNIGNVGGLENIKGQIGDISGGNIGNDSKDIQQISKGNLSEVKALPKTAEAKAEELSGLNDAKEQTQVLDKYKDMEDKMQSPDSLKEFAKQEIKQVAVNHFAGKEQQLKEAMETVAKYKTKYSSLNNIGEIAKRPPNEMRGKPLIERIVPGIAMQVQKRGDDLMVDFNPYFGYRFSGRITAGLGWNQRVAYNVDKTRFNPDARIFGPRAFGEFKLWKGFSPRVELETMNTSVPPLTRTSSLDPGKREWIWGAFVGMKKEYRIIRTVKGTALVMIRLNNTERKSPYADVLNVRFGFEFPMKKKSEHGDR